MGAEQLRQLLKKRPFRLYVSDGATYDVTHPEVLSVFRTHVQLGIPASHLPGCPVERMVYVSLLHITRVEVYSPQ
jgi:hypothetical protein